MGEWFRDHLWAAWLVLALVLAGAEMLTLDLTLLMLAGGALAAAGVAVVLPGAWLVQVLVGVVVALAMLGLLRPTLLAKIRKAPGYRNSITSLVGSTAVTSSAIDRGHGEVKVNGDTWSARSWDADVTIDVGEEVEVFEVEGTSLIVYPKNRPLGTNQRGN
ncbi:NfeD family protein [Aestuariimicrobium soli]|uniref:NfeD family protein n=1 Tax=Aestuariimicrobium soli TaxID=2035834 RepID=UPI003EBF989E